MVPPPSSTVGGSGEVDPLLPKRLNPLATSFISRQSTGDGSHYSHSHSPSPSTSSQHHHHHLPAPPSTSTSASHSPVPAPTNPSTEDLHWTLQRAHTLSPHTRNSESETDSQFSFASIVPTRTAFRRSHLWVQFPVTGIVWLGFAAGLAAWKREIRWWEVGLGASAWLASETIKHWIYELLTSERRDKDGEIIRGTGQGLPTIVMAVVQEFLRLGAIIMAVALLPEPTPTIVPTVPPRPPTSPPRQPPSPLPPLDTLFFSALWLATGWAMVEILWGSRDFWRRMQLYDDVLEDAEPWDEEAEELIIQQYTAAGGTGDRSLYGATALTMRGEGLGVRQGSDKRVVTVVDPDEELSRQEREAEVEAKIRELEREEVEGQLGVPLFEIPVFVVICWRIDSILLSLVLTLLLSLPFRTTSPSLVPFPLWPTFAGAAVTHVFLSLLWVLRIPSVGIPSVSYATLVILVFLLFAVLGAWGALE